jgi:micrococcal nuclease
MMTRGRRGGRETLMLAAMVVALAHAVASGACAAPGSAAVAGRQAAGERFTARVVHVFDGDSMIVERGGQRVDVRLHGVDAPEGGQAYGDASKRFLTDLVFGKSVAVEVRDIDPYNRRVSRLSLDGRDVGVEIIRAGAGWHYTRYSSDQAYSAAEADARAARRGLWADASPTPPWTYREVHGRGGASGRGRTGAAAGRSANAEGASVAGPFHGNVTSKVFHAPGCNSYACRSCTAEFPTSAAAVAAGYRPHADCVRPKQP